MAGGNKANINPDILVWARQTAGYNLEEAAHKIGVNPEKLQAWEEGASKPTLRQLRLAGKVYRRPSALFYRATTPTPPPNLRDFRLLPDTELQYTPNLRFEIRRAFERRAIALDITYQLGEQPPDLNIKADMSEDPRRLAKRIRDLLGVSVDTQFSWRDHYVALKTWISAVEGIGIFVFQVSGVEVQQMRGFSISDRPFPVIGINSKDSPRGRIFTLLHELTHIVLEDGGLCDLHETELIGDQSLEAYCNRVAGEILVPTDALLNHDIVIHNLRDPNWEDWELNTIANKFKVSQEVILRRLLILGRTAQNFYINKRKEYKEQYQRQSEENGGGFMLYHRRVLRNNGPAFTSLLLNAYYNEAITSRDLSNFLGGVNLSHVERIEQELLGIGERGGEI